MPILPVDMGCREGHSTGECAKTECAKTGALASLVEALTVHSGDEEVCRYACAALADVTHDAENKRHVVQVGAVPPLAAAYVAHATARPAAYAALAALGYDDDGSVLISSL